MKKTYHPGFLRRLNRRIVNVFKTVRDSVTEVVNLLLAQAKTKTPAGRVLSSQDKYVSQMKSELMGSVGASYEPLLEKYIGSKVVLEMVKAEKVIEYPCILKDYTAQFIEIMDVDYSITAESDSRKADMIIPRNIGRVRHLAE